MKKSGITVNINHNFVWIRIDSYDSLPFAKILTIPNVISLTKSAVNKNKNEDFHNIFLETGLYNDKYNTKYFWVNSTIL